MRKANINNQLLTTNSWDTICFPVKSVPARDVLPDPYRVVPTDRQHFIVGTMPNEERQIFAAQSPRYSLIPNSIIRDAVTEVTGIEQDVHIRYSRNGEYAINVILPDETTVGPNDVIQRQLTFTNSYTGKSQFTIQGTEMKRVREQKVRVAFYRQICSNGMMGWADDFVSLDQYLDWLVTGQTPEKARVKGLEWVYESAETLRAYQHIFTHRGINLNQFRSFLVNFLRDFLRYAQDCPSPTQDVFKVMQDTAVTDRQEAAQLVRKVGVSQKLVDAALERMATEECALGSGPNAWLLYNGVNHALFNGNSGLTLPARYALDEKVFHAVAAHYIL
jgi:hypothetical protein